LKKTHDYIHHYRGYWSDGGKCRIRIYHEDGSAPVVICSQPPDNDNTSVTNMAEYIAAEVIAEHDLLTPLVWVEHYPEHKREIGEHSLVRFSCWEPREARLGGVRRYQLGSPQWSPLTLEEMKTLLRSGPSVGKKWQMSKLSDRRAGARRCLQQLNSRACDADTLEC
jgi:hypothetical protein